MREFWLDLKIKIKSYFVFTHGEKRGTIILLLIICLLSAAILWVNYRPRPATDFTDFYKAIAELKAQQSVATEDSLTVEMQDSLKVFSSRKAAKQELFPFDPNNASAEEWNKLGLSNKQIHVIQNYISHGGHFYKKEDLLKIYSISNETYKRLESYININENEKQAVKPFDTTNNASNNKGIKNKIAQPLLDINTATQEQLESLQGVGKWIATNIIKYREKLGGYFDASQLLEVRYINDSVYQIIQQIGRAHV